MSSLLIQKLTDHWEKLTEIADGTPISCLVDYNSGKKEMYAVLCCKHYAKLFKIKGNIQEKLLSDPHSRMITFNNSNSLELIKNLDTDNPCYEQMMKTSETDRPVLFAFTFLI